MKERELFKDNRGISGVVVAMLLTVIGIAGVVILWTVVLPMLYSIDFEIVDVKLEVVEKPGGQKSYQVSIQIWNTGTIDITSLKIDCSDIGLNNKELLEQGETLNKGERINFVITEGFSEFKVGTPYTIIVRAEGRSPFGVLRKTDRSITATAVRD
ncbi:hypothetical protein KEJ17_04130 [Candidatus Bathyarchaeota archaeon]|nr:hypothetical protein [Candidatus Bathyarchaeota archaeon]